MGKTGILVISHGSRSETWIRLVDEAVDAVRVPEGVPIVSAFLELVQGRLIQDGIDELERQGVSDLIVVPLFVSRGSTHVAEIRHALGDLTELPDALERLERFRLKANVYVCAPLDDDPVVAEMVYDHIRELSVRPEREHVLLVGHGSGLPDFYEGWKRGFGEIARMIGERGRFASVETALLLPDETRQANVWSRVEQAGREETVIVAPLFLSRGYFTDTVIPGRLDGLAYRYAGKALLPHPLVAAWMERRIADSLLQIERYGESEMEDSRWANGRG